MDLAAEMLELTKWFKAARATSAAAAAGAPNSDAPLAPEHRRRRHVFVLSRSRGPVRNLDLEAIDF